MNKTLLLILQFVFFVLGIAAGVIVWMYLGRSLGLLLLAMFSLMVVTALVSLEK